MIKTEKTLSNLLKKLHNIVDIIDLPENEEEEIKEKVYEIFDYLMYNSDDDEYELLRKLESDISSIIEEAIIKRIEIEREED